MKLNFEGEDAAMRTEHSNPERLPICLRYARNQWRLPDDIARR